MFSPYYAWSGRRDPLNHVAFNVALYGRRERWAMTERGRRQAKVAPEGFAVSRSGIRVDGDDIVVTVDERCAPLPRRLKGTVRLSPAALSPTHYGIDADGRHRWRPIAPASPITVEMDEPRLSWRGTGYFDMNWGDVPLEASFAHWNWMRVDLGDGSSAILYDTVGRDGSRTSLSLLGQRTGEMTPAPMPPQHALPATLWRVPRAAWSEDGPPTVRRNLEDTPFYTRTELSARIHGAARTAIHESLSLRRFDTTLVKLMLPFRMPRIP